MYICLHTYTPIHLFMNANKQDVHAGDENTIQAETISPATLDLLQAAKVIFFIRVCVTYSRYEYARVYGRSVASRKDSRFLVVHDEQSLAGLGQV